MNLLVVSHGSIDICVGQQHAHAYILHMVGTTLFRITPPIEKDILALLTSQNLSQLQKLPYAHIIATCAKE